MNEYQKLFDDIVSFYVSDCVSGSSGIVANTNIYKPTYTGDSIPFIGYSTPINYPTIVYKYSQTKPEFPGMRITQDKAGKYFEIEIAIAGFSKADIKIEADDKYLYVSGERKVKELQSNEIEMKNNLKINEFERAFSFPADCFDFKNPKISFVDGLLTIRVDELENSPIKRKEITIE